MGAFFGRTIRAIRSIFLCCEVERNIEDRFWHKKDAASITAAIQILNQDSIFDRKNIHYYFFVKIKKVSRYLGTLFLGG